MSIQNNYVAIMAGGIGSRFWPESRQSLPKQFLDILGTGRTFIQDTYARFKDICPKENIYVVTHHSYEHLVKEQLPELPENNIIKEPFRKNTAPAAAYVTYKLQAINPKANIILAPADHLILDQRNFEIKAFQGLDYASRNDAILTFGIQPTRPDTGYGYIQYAKDQLEEGIAKVVVFTEKPDLDLARVFLSSGDFVWNSGIFVWNVDTFTKAFKAYQPEMAEVFEQGRNAYNTPKEYATMERLYTQTTNLSIDYGLMEKANNVFVIPSNFGWSDLGTWESAYEHSEKDYLGNASNQKSIFVVDASNCMVKSDASKLVVLQGLQDYIIVDTPDVLLICERSQEQQIKEYVAEIKRNLGEKYL
ncbi:MAG: mannose-1-phosphate guanylyltransferase [Sphingobacteriales bacterium]|nr:MAG: mannose-1-phosphate guanylyltransferase [Sphingobacteriales bacterium]